VVADPRASRTAHAQHAAKAARGKGSASGLHALLATGTLDSTVRMGFLTFLPFLLKSKGAGTAGIGIALSLLFVGGAFGKLLCGYLGAHRHDENGVGHRVGHLAVHRGGRVPAADGRDGHAAAAGPGVERHLVGAVRRGAGTGGAGKREQAFALFYTGTIGAGALSPVLFGRVGDVMGVPVALLSLAAILLLTLPLSWRVQKAL
jgi:hypothetical protein